MRFYDFFPFSFSASKKTTLILASLLLAGCSSNTMRFADGMFTNSTSSKQSVNRPMPEQPIPPSVTGSMHGSTQEIESNALPPIEDAPLQSSNKEQQTQVAGLGTPPRNLGTLPANEVKTPMGEKTQSRYIVQSGDTLGRIASRQGVSVAELRKANELKGDMIRIGQSLTIPSSSAAVSTPVPTLVRDTRATPAETTTIAKLPADTQPGNEGKAEVKPTAATTPHEADVKTATTEQKTTKDEQQLAALTPPTGVATLRWPAKGRILSSFGQREGSLTNDGVDIMVPEGTIVKAAENGVVIYAGDGLKEFGNTILIRHEDNLVTVYGHNSQLLVQRGQKVRRGDDIAKSGKSGNTTTPKLHFEVRKNSTPVNPMKYLES